MRDFNRAFSPMSGYGRPFFSKSGCVLAIGSLLMLLWGCSLHNLPSEDTANPAAASIELSPDEYMEKGTRFFERGAFDEAIESWAIAARSFEKDRRSDKQCEALIELSRAYLSVGHHKKALQNLESALALAEKSGDRRRIVLSKAGLGNVYIVTGPLDEADRYLKEGLALSMELKEPRLSAIVLNNMGNLLAARKNYKDALTAYTESLGHAKAIGDDALGATATSNAAMVSMQEGQYKESKRFADESFEIVRRLDHSHDKIYKLINIGLTYQGLTQHFPEPSKLISLAFEALSDAVVISRALQDHRALSYAYGYLGKLYEDTGSNDEALQLTQAAVFSAQQANTPESLYKWQWQTARIFSALGNIDDAITAYRNAGLTIQSIRGEMSECYGRPKIAFREAAGPLFLEFVDLLLKRAASIEDSVRYEPYLLEAREAVEMLKVHELRDYFEDDCVDAARSRTTRLEDISQTALVIYPILLPDRMEILVSLPSGMKRFTVQAGTDTVTQTIREFRKHLENRTTREYLGYAQKLYNWLIRPLEPDLAALSIDTLVFVPDGPLRTVPMAALHDGRDFLISNYAVAITPGLDLTDPRPVGKKDLKALAVGLTESVQGFPALPYVRAELETVQNIYEAKLLMNKDFNFQKMEKSLRDEPFTLVHIASHSKFESDVDKTFILAFDGRLSMDYLNRYVGLLQFRDVPLELLTLSACQTAAGDDRAALGLGGIAIKAGARSALATLWHINDHASSLLISEFYHQLHSPSVSRALALQRAQLKLLNHRWYRHPGYWSPFLLINNWL